MRFLTYKPRPVTDKVKAIQVTTENIGEIATEMFGEVITDFQFEPTSPEVTVVAIPTLKGAKHYEIGSWIVRNGGALGHLTDAEFQKTYEVARNTTGS
jgi:hypothetical protein